MLEIYLQKCGFAKAFALIEYIADETKKYNSYLLQEAQFFLAADALCKESHRNDCYMQNINI